MENYDVLGSSLLQSVYSFVEQCLIDYKSLQPEFDYVLSFGTNLDNEQVYENDKFNIVLYTGVVDKIPSHFANVNGVNQILFAGYLDITMSIVAPISLQYIDDLKIYSQKDKEYNDEFFRTAEENYGDSNILSPYDENKIQLGTRLLEQLSLFLTRKSMVVNNFKFSIRCDMPVIEGQVELGLYRLVQSLTPMCKFVWLNDLGKSLYSGEETRFFITFQNDSFSGYETTEYEFYNLLEIDEMTNMIKKNYPLYNESTTKALGNHYNRIMEIGSPDFDLGALSKLTEYKHSGNLKKLQDVKCRYYDGKNDWQFYAIIDGDVKSNSMDKFSSRNITITITSDIVEL